MTKAFRSLPARMRCAVLLGGLQLLILVLLRLVFCVVFRSRAGELAEDVVAKALWIGFKFDVRLVIEALLPFLVLSWIPALDPTRRPVARKGWFAFYVGLQLVMLLLYAIDFGHYDYLHERLNAAALDLILSPVIALQMVWETYPVIPGVLALGAAGWGYAWIQERVAFRQLDRAGAVTTRRRGAATWTVFTLLCVGGIYGKLQWYPLRWSDAYFTTNTFVSALALNPVLLLVDSLPNREQPYDEELIRERYDVVADILGVEERDRESLSFARWVVPEARDGKPLNLVIIHLESWVTFKTRAFGNPLNASPHFDAIAADSLLFTNFFVTHGPTARSVFTMLTGLPDLNPVRSASRNPGVVHQHTLINALAGYARHYFLGGSANWANIRAVLSNNVENLVIHEEGDFVSPRTDVWGISDLVLFEEAHRVLEAEQEPFFAFVQTSGNHRPYSIPADSRGFELEDPGEEALIAGGFFDAAAYNGFRFLDHSLGHFFELVSQEPFFENTVFLMYGDHGVTSPIEHDYPAIGLIDHVPFVLYAPGVLEAGRRVEDPCISADILPTALGFMGVPYLNTTLGRDILVPRTPERDYAFVRYGLMTDDLFYRSARFGPELLYAFRSAEPTRPVERPEELAELRWLHETLWEWSLYAMYNNPPRSHVPPTALSDG